MKTDDELLALLRVVGSWTDEKTEALLTLLERGVNSKVVADAGLEGIPTHCKHDRWIWDTCLACEEEDQENES